jgi:hypothetical protein
VIDRGPAERGYFTPMPKAVLLSFIGQRATHILSMIVLNAAAPHVKGVLMRYARSFGPLALWTVVAAASAQPEYELFIIDSLAPGYTLAETYIRDINVHGVAGGWTTIRRQTPQGTTITYTGLIWRELAGREPVGVGNLTGINAQGVAVGSWGVLDTATGLITSEFPVLPSPTTYYQPVFNGINDQGVAVGYILTRATNNSNGTYQIPYIWNSSAGTARTLAVPGANGAWRINNAGQVVGWRGGVSMPFWYHYDLATEQYTMVEDLFPPNPQAGRTTAVDVSHAGVVVGQRTQGNATYGYTWVPGSAPSLLPLPAIPGYSTTFLQPTSINSSGTIVGLLYREASPAGYRPFIYDEVNGIRDLSALAGTLPPGFNLNHPWRINDAGWIVGYGSGGGEYTRGFILKPIQSSCYANCDQSTTTPVLNVDDFTCFINEFALGQALPHEQQVGHYANCDQSSTAPVLNIDDFTCFINAFAQGCP